MARHWLAVASADHVRTGRKGGFMQLDHGRNTRLKRIQPGDRIVYYSPTDLFRGGTKLQAFTALGTVSKGEPYQADMGDGFEPWRRDVRWRKTRDVPLAEVRDRLHFTQARNWGYRLRLGLIELDAADMTSIARAMLRPRTRG